MGPKMTKNDGKSSEITDPTGKWAKSMSPGKNDEGKLLGGLCDQTFEAKKIKNI
jgi:hypothetical protein